MDIGVSENKFMSTVYRSDPLRIKVREDKVVYKLTVCDSSQIRVNEGNSYEDFLKPRSNMNMKPMLVNQSEFGPFLGS